MADNGVMEDFLIVKGDGEIPWFAQDKERPNRKITISSGAGDTCKIYHRKKKKPADPSKNASVLVAELNGVALYIKGDDMVLAPAPFNHEGIYHTQVLI